MTSRQGFASPRGRQIPSLDTATSPPCGGYVTMSSDILVVGRGTQGPDGRMPPAGHPRTALDAMNGVTVGDPVPGREKPLYGLLWRSERVIARFAGISGRHTLGVMEHLPDPDVLRPFPAFPVRNQNRPSSWRDRRRSGSCSSSASWPEGAKSDDSFPGRKATAAVPADPSADPLSPDPLSQFLTVPCLDGRASPTGPMVEMWVWTSRPAPTPAWRARFRRWRLPTPARTGPLHDQAERLRGRVQRGCWAVSPQVYQWHTN